MTISKALAEDLRTFGGILRCRYCGATEPIGNLAYYLRRGRWPKHCGDTMRWVPARELESGR